MSGPGAPRSADARDANRPRVAFVVPAWNAGRTIGATLESALAQDDSQIEIVVVDDGSTDGTREVVAAFATRDSRVRLLADGVRRGPAAARNLGASASTAPYLCFLDADDLVPADKARAQAEFLQQHPESAVVYSPAVQFTDGEDGPEQIVAMEENPGRLREALLTGGVAFPPLCALVRRTAFLSVGGFDPVRFQLNEDTLLFLRLALDGFGFAFLPMSPVRYRRHPQSRSQNSLVVLRERIEMAEWLSRLPGLESRRPALRSRRRFLTLILAETLARHGRRSDARATAFEALRLGFRPGEIREVAAFLISPDKTRWTSPEMSHAQSHQGDVRRGG